MSAQTIFRRAHASNFVAISNELAREVTLSHRERGLLVWLLSYPPDWIVSLQTLVTADDSLRSLRRVVQRLEDAGYIKRERERDPATGRLGRAVLFVYDEPLPIEQRTHDNRRKASPKTKNETLEPKTKKRTQADTGSDTGKTPMTKNPHVGFWPTTNTEEETKREDKERDAPPTDEDGIPDHVPPNLRRIAEGKEPTPANPDGNATAYQIAERYCDAWDIIVERYRKAIHRDQKRYAKALADMGATPEDVFEMCKAKRTAGKEPADYGLRLVQLDWPGWKSHRDSKARVIVLTEAQIASARAAEEEWQRETAAYQAALAGGDV